MIPDGEWGVRRSRLTAAGWALSFLAGTFLLAAALFAVLLRTADVDMAVMGSPGVAHVPVFLLLQSAVVIAAALFITCCMMRWGPRLSPRELRWRVPGRASRARRAAAMFAWGATAALVAMVLAVAPGGGAWGSDAGSWRGYLMHGVATLLLLAPAAIAEELTFRGAPLILFASALGRGPATIVMAVLFALAHAANPNVTLTGLVNIGLAGVVLAMAVFSSGGLAAATGLHLGWNAGLAWLDAPVSGIAPATPLIDFLPGTPAWWTGGAFGPEGGLAATVTLGAMGWLLHRFTRKDTE